MTLPARTYTAAEKAKRARLLFKGAHGAYGDTSRIERELDRIDRAAADRADREAAAHGKLLDKARKAVAAARIEERAARGKDRSPARDARKAAEKRLRDIERARR